MITENAISEEELLKRLKEGDQKAFAEVYLRYHDGLLTYLLKFTKNPAQSEDLVHDIFLKIWEARGKIHIQSSFSSYLYRFARNAALNQLKHLALDDRYQQEALHRVSLGMNEQSLLNQMQWHEYSQLLARALSNLTPARREAFRLCREEGRSYEEAAALMGISRNTLKEHLTLAVKFIKRYLLEHGEITLMLLVMPFL